MDDQFEAMRQDTAEPLTWPRLREELFRLGAIDEIGNPRADGKPIRVTQILNQGMHQHGILALPFTGKVVEVELTGYGESGEEGRIVLRDEANNVHGVVFSEIDEVTSPR